MTLLFGFAKTFFYFTHQEIKIAEIERMITTKEPNVERVSALFSLLDQLIADCR